MSEGESDATTTLPDIENFENNEAEDKKIITIFRFTQPGHPTNTACRST